MRLSSLCLLTVGVILLPGCCSVHPAEVPAEHSTRSPRYTTEYLRWAYVNDRPLHVFNCLSDHFREVNKVSLGDIVAFWQQMKDALDRYVGSVKDVEIDEIREVPGRPRMRDVLYVNGPHRATVRFELQTTWQTIPMSVRKENGDGSLPSMGAAVRQTADGMVIQLPNTPQEQTPDELHRIRLDNQWLIRAIVEHNLEEVEAAMRKAAEERQRD